MNGVMGETSGIRAASQPRRLLITIAAATRGAQPCRAQFTAEVHVAGRGARKRQGILGLQQQELRSGQSIGSA